MKDVGDSRNWDFLPSLKMKYSEREEQDHALTIERLKHFPFFEKNFSKFKSSGKGPGCGNAFDTFVLECSKWLAYEYLEPGQ
jgi:hypothetical protein